MIRMGAGAMGMAVWLAVLSPGAYGQAGANGFESRDNAEDVQRLSAVVRRMVSHLHALPAFHVTIVQSWTLQGPQPAEGENRASLMVEHGGRFRLEIGREGVTSSSLICGGDDKTITRLLRSPGQSVYSRHDSGGWQRLLEDAMTEVSMRHSGLDWFCHPNPHAYVMTMSSQVDYVGEADLPGGRAHHFRLNWGHGDAHVCEIWVAADKEPRLMRMTQTIVLDIQPDQPTQLAVTSEWDWQPVDALSDEQLRVDIPEGALEVVDLHSHLVDGAAATLVGQKLPALELKRLDGMTWELPAGKRTVLYFFATWAVPSHAEKQQLLDMLRADHGDTVDFLAVAIDQDVATVRAFAQSREYAHAIASDPERKAATACRVTSLPTTFVVDTDGKVIAAHVGNTRETRDALNQDLQRLAEPDTTGDAQDDCRWTS